MSSALSSVSLPHTRYFPPTPSSWFPPGGSSICLPLLLSLSATAVVSVASHFPLAAPTLLRFAPPPYLCISPAPLPPPPPTLGLLHPPAPPCAPHPTALAADIACKDEDVGDQTGVGEAFLLTVGGSAPTESSLAVSSPLWGTASTVPCSCTGPNSSTPCTAGRRSVTHTSC